MCGGPGPLTDEDVISKTVRKHIPVLGQIQQMFGGVARGRPLNVMRMVLADAVCGPCNNVWMSQLENDLTDNLGPQFTSTRAVRLDPSQQERTATWAIKTALLIETFTNIAGDGESGAYVPTDNLRWLAAHRSPPPGCSAWLAAIDIGTKFPSWSQAGSVFDSRGKPKEFVATFTFGHLGFQVISGDIDNPRLSGAAKKPLADETPDDVRAVSVNIWPGTGDDAVWPPGVPLTMNNLQAWAAWPSRFLPPPPEDGVAP
jgi:hypothetical protein